MLKSICLGRSKYELNILVDKMPLEGSSNEFFNKLGCGGGTAGNVAYALGKWGIGTAVSGVIGNDIYGSRIKEEYDSAHLDTRYLEQTYSNDTQLSLIVTNKETKNFTTYNISDKYVSIKKMDYDFTPDITVVDGYDTVAAKALLERFPHCKTVLCANFISKEVFDLCHRAKYVVCPLSFAEMFTGIKYDAKNVKSLAEIYQIMKKKNLNTEFIIHLGDEGALYCINNQIKISPLLQVEVVDKHGDYDAFCAAFSYSIAIDGDLEKAIKFGCISASLVTRTLGGRCSFPSIDEVKKLYEQNY